MAFSKQDSTDLVPNRTELPVVPTVSLVIATYNRSQRLAQEIAAVLNQTYPHFELLIWDDGSSDETWAVAEQFCQLDSRVRVYRAAHRGTVRSLISALEFAKGTYIGWLGDDDILDPRAIAATIAVLQPQDHQLSAPPTIGVVYTDYVDIDGDGQVLGYGERCQIPYSSTQMLLDFISGQFRLIRRDLYDHCGGLNAFFPFAYDYELCLRLSEITEFQRIAQPLYFYRTHSQSQHVLHYQELIDDAQRAIALALDRRELAQLWRVEFVGDRFYLQPQETEPQRERSGRPGSEPIPLQHRHLQSVRRFH